MKEFIIRSEQGDDFGLHVSAWQNALTPLGFACEVLPGLVSNISPCALTVMKFGLALKIVSGTYLLPVKVNGPVV